MWKIISVAVEVRQGTLSADGRGWGPAWNTEHRWSRLRSGLEHWAQMVAVEVRQGTLSADDRSCRLTLDSTTTKETKEDEEEEEEEEEAE